MSRVVVEDAPHHQAKPLGHRVGAPTVLGINGHGRRARPSTAPLARVRSRSMPSIASAPASMAKTTESALAPAPAPIDGLGGRSTRSSTSFWAPWRSHSVTGKTRPASALQDQPEC
jgi:hypothetical protein